MYICGAAAAEDTISKEEQELTLKSLLVEVGYAFIPILEFLILGHSEEVEVAHLEQVFTVRKGIMVLPEEQPHHIAVTKFKPQRSEEERIASRQQHVSLIFQLFHLYTSHLAAVDLRRLEGRGEEDTSEEEVEDRMAEAAVVARF
eukprot:gene23728-25259_t